jgi:hypothetical protein
MIPTKLNRISARIALSIAFAAGVAALTACNPETEQEAEALDRAADSNQAPLRSCTYDSVDKLRMKYLSHNEQIDVCNTMQAALGRPSTVGLTRKMSSLAALMQMAGSKDTAREVTYQTMNVEARGQIQDNSAIAGSLDTIYKIFSATQGHVTPRDLSVLLRSSGPTAQTISDEGLARMAFVLWEEMKANGG